MAIRGACAALGSFSLEGSDIYTSCEPCPMCLGAIYWARLRHIYYANTRRDAAAIGFDEAVGRVQSAWAEVLSRTETEGGAAGDRTRFASALYRACLHPSLYSDADGSYRDAKGQVRRVRDGRPRHTVFSLWDTYRTVFPLYALLWPERLSNLVGNLLDLQAESGWLPKWELGGTETFIMPGDPALPVLADALARDVPGLDHGRIREAVLHQVDAMDASGHSDVRPGLGAYLRYGYLPDDLDVPARPIWTTTMKGSVSHTLEYAYADWSAARILERLGEDSHARRLDARGASWRNLLHPGTCFFRPRNADGAWVEPFDPRSRSGGTWDSRSARGFVEGHAWHYRFAVPHAIPELMALHGGPAPFAAALRQLFDEDLYDGTNEPDMAYPFLFNQIPGHEALTAPTVGRCLRRFWRDGRDGLPGDDDCGTLSTWLLFAMMGFYPDCPGLPRSQLFAPAFDRVLLRLPQGKTWEIEARRARPGAMALRSLRVNGQAHPSLVLAHATQARGGTIRYDLD
jgi:predicted alpha-1,2-mannosidase